MLLDGADDLRQPLGQRHAAAFDADQPDILAAVILFDDFVGEPDERPLDLRSGHQFAFFAQNRFLIWGCL